MGHVACGMGHVARAIKEEILDTRQTSWFRAKHNTHNTHNGRLSVDPKEKSGKTQLRTVLLLGERPRNGCQYQFGANKQTNKRAASHRDLRRQLRRRLRRRLQLRHGLNMITEKNTYMAEEENGYE